MADSRTMDTTTRVKAADASALKDFLSLIKIGIVNSNLITAFTGMWLALELTNRHFLQSLDIMVLAMAGTALIVAGSCSLNNWYDRDIDVIMKSKNFRPTVTGRFSNAKVLTIGLGFVAIGTLLLFMTTPMAGLIGLFGVFSYVVLYTMWSKRTLVSNTVIGSFAGAVPPLIGWAAVDPHLGIVPWMLFLLMFIWQPPHFYAIAMKKCEEYKAAGIPMLPAVKGFQITKWHMLIWVALLIPVPFFLKPLGIGFIILATLFNLGWLALSLSGLKMKNDLKWAKWMFIYSLNYLTILFVAMVIATLF
ncbi:protoheme IX farnesyltransferase [Heyndrickxia coagulans]|uniref:heme o synthase n=1 Tax=Heyndrickxia coagulans TaxID=1398 RepID=UPI000D728A9E|nr:heme o synthase [Heyndrickxia coagulans]AWP36584.1 protoheme IX farnesyltransferase [Heyndrickxia coagulans]QDI62085.1 protoheme IX farnesyltransferase [Heyndrickxia coagulans]